MSAYMSVHIYPEAHAHPDTSAFTPVCAHTHMHMHVSMHIPIHMPMHMPMHTNIHIALRASVHICATIAYKTFETFDETSFIAPSGHSNRYCSTQTTKLLIAQPVDGLAVHLFMLLIACQGISVVTAHQRMHSLVGKHIYFRVARQRAGY